MSVANPPVIGRLAVHYRMITAEQLAEVLRENGGAKLAEALVARGLVTQAEAAALARKERELREKQRAEKGAGRAGADARPARAAGRSAPPAGAKGAAEDKSRRRLERVLKSAVGHGASDVHLHSGAPLTLRANGEIVQSGEPLDPADVEAAVRCALPPREAELFDARGEIDFCYTLEGVGRFRANVYRQQRGVDAVFRFILPRAPSLGELSLPESLAQLTHFHQGMVLVTGPTGCGKSSTMAALVNVINAERHEHIVSIEDPIEFVHAPQGCLVNQRSVGRDTESFARALRAALREDPDVIVIGELRDRETVSLALTAAETGHLVLATLHTDSSIRTVDRLVGSFPADQQDQVRTMVSESLRAVISQKLVRRADGKGRVPALETLIVTRAVGNLIRENKSFQIHSILQTGATQGMRLMDHSLRELVQSGTITADEARRLCQDPKALGS